MQLADMVAHAFYRAYNVGDWRWADSLRPAVCGADENRLMHFTKATCSCPACAGPAEPVATAPGAPDDGVTAASS